MKLIIGFTAVITVVLLILLYSRLSKRRQRSNVVSLHKHKQRKAKEAAAVGQICSRCSKQQPLMFYANDAGVVRGLCKECKKVAEKREELYPV